MMNPVWKIADVDRPDSVATSLRRRRFGLFTSLLAQLQRPLRILDVGGTQSFWEMMGFIDQPGVEIVLLNLARVDAHRPGFSSVVGDARQMGSFARRQFDVVFSNSVIEHVGTFEQQQQMAREVMRVGQRYFVQTPNYYFPVEPHFLFPLFQFLPVNVRVLLHSTFDMGWHKRAPDKQSARALVNSIRLLTERELRALFPGAQFYREKVIGLTKSFIVFDGW